MGRNEITAMIATVLFAIVLIFGVVVSANAEEVNEYSLITVDADDEDWEMLHRVCRNEVVGAFELGEDGEWECLLATIETVFNRKLKGGWYGDSIKEVCTKKNQFVCRPTKRTEAEEELISDAICYVLQNGRTQTNSINSTFFATFKQRYGHNHIWRGKVDKNGNPVKGKGMWFSEE